MKQSAEKRQFEKAAELRDQWEGAQNILAHRHVLEEKIVGTGSNFSYLFLMSRIKRIEGYDISNIQGKWAVGSMVVFSQDANGNFHPEKSEYRKFRIRTVRGANDPAMMKEVFKRRLIHKEWLFPDLIVVDGGKTQRNAALEALNALDKTTPVFGLAKREEELYTERGVIHLSSLPASYELLFRYIRDEAHRFAISYYRKLHRKTITTSI